MLDPRTEEKLLEALKSELRVGHVTLGAWAVHAFKSQISIFMIRAYQEGMRDALLKMGSYLKH